MPEIKKINVKAITMEENKTNNKVLQALNKFDQLEALQPSEEWNNSLMAKIANSKKNTTAVLAAPRYTVAILFLLLVNIGFILISITHHRDGNTHGTKEMQVISREILINPISINN